MFILLGMRSNGVNGATPLSWVDINSFVSCSGNELNGWECEQLINMSRVYCNMLHAASEISCPAPYGEYTDTDDKDAVQAMRERVNKQWDSFFK